MDIQVLNKILKSNADSTANKVCKRIESLVDADILSTKEAFILKSNLKNIVHESFREVKNHIICWQNGHNFTKLKIYKTPKNTV